MEKMNCPNCGNVLEVDENDLPPVLDCPCGMKFELTDLEPGIPTGPPEDWDGIPRVYIHDGCGKATAVSDDIVSTCRADPWFYLPGSTICATCGPVPDKTCTWVESGERVDEYMRRLKREKGAGYHIVRWGLHAAFIAAGVLLVPQLFQQNPLPKPWDIAAGIGAGMLCGFLIGRYIRLALCKIKLI